MSRRSAFGRRAALSTLSILVALLIAGQAVTIYFVYQQSGQISKLTKTSQNLQLEALQRKLPKSQYPPGHRRDGGGTGRGTGSCSATKGRRQRGLGGPWGCGDCPRTTWSQGIKTGG